MVSAAFFAGIMTLTGDSAEDVIGSPRGPRRLWTVAIPSYEALLDLVQVVARRSGEKLKLPQA
jgi:hypothetical protein